MNYSHVSIILSTYNESTEIEFTICEIIRRIPGAEIIVVDDNSPDGTYEILKNNNPGIYKIGEAYQTNFVPLLDNLQELQCD